MKANLPRKILFVLTVLLVSNAGWCQDAQDITIDLKKPDTEHKTDFSKNFKIKFINAKTGAKMDVKISSEDPQMAEELLKGADLSARTIDFTHDPAKKKPVVKNAANADVGIDGNFKITIGDNEYSIVKTNATIPQTKAGVETEKKIPYWAYLGDDKAGSFSLKSFFLDPSGKQCCDDCESCDNTAFDENNRIIYDARSGVTYFVPQDAAAFELCTPAKMKQYRVGSRKKIALDAGDPVVLIVENVNPALYNVEISDSSFLTNNESTGLLESLLFQKTEGEFSDKTAIQGSDDGIDNTEHLVAKAGLLLVRAEMAGLLENFRLSNLYLHNCIQKKKHEALKEINGYPAQLLKGKYSKLSFLQLVDIFLNQETEDSLLNKQIRTLYSEFQTASYKIAYRYPQIPERDILNFRIAIKPKPSAPYPGLLNTQMRNPTQTIYVRRFFKVDVSSGLYMGSKKDQTYSLVAHSSTGQNGQPVDVKRIVKEGGNKELGFVSYLHMYYKFSSQINPAFTLGAGISFDRTVRPRYFTGLSLLVGQHNRICITGGAIWGNYEALSKQYAKTGKEFDFLNASTTDLSYKTTFKGGWFVSLSYNLPFLKRKSSSEAKPGSSDTAETDKEKSASKASTPSAKES